MMRMCFLVIVLLFAACGNDNAVGTAPGFALKMSASVTANCSPIVIDDPWQVTFDVTYDNGAGQSSVTTIWSALLHFGNDDELQLAVAPMDSGTVPMGFSPTVTHTKVSTTPDLADDCSHCDENVILEVAFGVNGQPATLSDQVLANCTY